METTLAFGKTGAAVRLPERIATTVLGTTIRFRPDRTIFAADAELDRERLLEELHGLAALIPKFTLELKDLRSGAPSETRLHCPRGLANLLLAVADTPRLALPIEATSWEDWPEEDDARAEVRLAMKRCEPGSRSCVVVPVATMSRSRM